jgi:hypothetical protein
MERIPTRDAYRAALTTTVYRDDPQEERLRRLRIRIGRLANPVYRLENFVEQIFWNLRDVIGWAEERGLRLYHWLFPNTPDDLVLPPSENPRSGSRVSM